MRFTKDTICPRICKISCPIKSFLRVVWSETGHPWERSTWQMFTQGSRTGCSALLVANTIGLSLTICPLATHMPSNHSPKTIRVSAPSKTETGIMLLCIVRRHYWIILMLRDIESLIRFHCLDMVYIWMQFWKWAVVFIWGFIKIMYTFGRK